MVTMTTLIGIGGSLAWLRAGAARAARTPRNTTAATLLRMSHGSEAGPAMPSAGCDTPSERASTARDANTLLMHRKLRSRPRQTSHRMSGCSKLVGCDLLASFFSLRRIACQSAARLTQILGYRQLCLQSGQSIGGKSLHGGVGAALGLILKRPHVVFILLHLVFDVGFVKFCPAQLRQLIDTSVLFRVQRLGNGIPCLC